MTPSGRESFSALFCEAAVLVPLLRVGHVHYILITRPTSVGSARLTSRPSNNKNKENEKTYLMSKVRVA